MNVQMAAAAGGVVFGLSFLAGLFGGVPFFDIVLRALIWGAVGFGGSLGIEMLLKSLLPDLFVPVAGDRDAEPAPERNVDITIEEERPSGFVEEEGAVPAPRADFAPETAAGSAASAPIAEAGAASDEEMPEIGSFLDAFKPQGAGDGAEEAFEEGRPAPEYGDYSPSSPASEVTIDGEAQDPVVMAKAIQTVLKRDAQGS